MNKHYLNIGGISIFKKKNKLKIPSITYLPNINFKYFITYL